MDREQLHTLLSQVRAGRIEIDQALEALATLPLRNEPDLTLDTHRQLRCGLPEIVYGEGKSPDQIAAAVAALAERHDRVLVTRATSEQFEAARAALPGLEHHPRARCFRWRRADSVRTPSGLVAVVTAGTSDLPVADEAALTLEMMDVAVERFTDIGVAGLHRLLSRIEPIRRADCVIVCAGMEGALPSVLGGLVSSPVVAVPTSVGYGASFQGLAALLGMLNSCAAGVGVVNIDNGFGAGVLAGKMARAAAATPVSTEENLGS